MPALFSPTGHELVDLVLHAVSSFMPSPSASPSPTAVAVDQRQCHVLHIGPVSGTRDLRVWAVVDGTNLVLQFDLPSGTKVGPTGHLYGWRHGNPRPLLQEVARNCGIKHSDFQHDFVYAGASWTSGLIQQPPPPSQIRKKPSTFDASSLPIAITISAGSRWVFRGRVIEVLTSTGLGLDSMLQVRVITAAPGRKPAAKKISVRSLFSKYSAS